MAWHQNIYKIWHGIKILALNKILSFFINGIKISFFIKIKFFYQQMALLASFSQLLDHQVALMSQCCSLFNYFTLFNLLFVIVVTFTLRTSTVIHL